MKKLSLRESLFFAVSLIAFILMLRVFLSQELYSDDIYYASFFNDGFYSFLKKARDHFESFNGRNLVHIIIWCSLALGRAFTALLTAGVFFSIPTVFAYGEGKKIPFSHIAFFAALTMALSPVILKESLFWTSGFFNYVFPLLCIIITIFLQKYLCENKVSIYIIILLCPVFFLLSATTEQAGASAVFAAVFCAIVYLIYNKRLYIQALAAPLCTALGWISIFASPATLARLNAETVGSTFSNVLSSLSILSHHILSCSSAFVLIIFLVTTVIFPSYFPRITRISGLLCAILITGTLFFKSVTYSFAVFIALCLYTVFYAILLILKKDIIKSAILLSGMVSAAVICFTASCEPRTASPFLLSIILFTASQLSDCSKHLKKVTAIPLFSLLIICISIFIPTFNGYLKNERIRNVNMNAIENAYTSGVLIYSMDYDPKYAHSLMYDDGYFYNAFVRLYNLQNTDISLTGTDLPVVYCEGIKLSCPAVIKDNTIFFPLEHTVSALGGTTSWSPSEMRISFYGKEISVVGNMVYSNSVNYDASLSIRRDFFCMLVTKEFLNDILGLEVTFDESNNTYEIILK